MSVLINFKICDNAKECGGVAICPTGALLWNEKKKGIIIDNKKCISCGRCVAECPVDAIFVARNEKEHEKIQKELDADPRKRTDLFIDRYGAVPIQLAFLLSDKEFQAEILDAEKLMMVEFFLNDSAMCLLKSIQIKELVGNYVVEYRKVEPGKKIIEKYQVKELPALLFFDKGKLLGKIEGYYEKNKKANLIKKINEIIK